MNLNLKDQSIIFYPRNEKIKQIMPPPQPMLVPQWFKDVPVYEKNENSPFNDKLFVENGETNYSAKTCLPFLDSLTSGYSFNLWCDIQVRIEKNGSQRITWRNSDVDLSPVSARPSPEGFPSPNGFNSLLFSWISHWGIKTPKGYSCIFTHPFNRTDLPFLTTTGIVDTDKWGIWGLQPFHMQRDWEGVIQAGTPIIQIYPFKRDNWNSKIDDSLSEWGNYENLRRLSKFRGYYKNKYWNKKYFK